VVNNHGDWNLVNSNHVTKASNLVRYITIPVETSNRYSLLDNLEGMYRNPSNGNIRNGKFINQVIPNVTHSLAAKIHHNKSKKVVKHVTSSNQQCIKHKNLNAMQLNLHEIADGHEKLLCTKEESTYCIPTIVNHVIIMGAREGIVSSGNDKLILSDSYPLMNLCNKPSSQNVKRKVVIIGDSHAGGCAARVKNLVSDKFEICGFVKPGSGVSILTKSEKKK
jgi:hypothetical protein